ncbi:hypothetical protein FOYG_11146 [Fusarium oxysporum NRRL 32931]|uniref:Uncharacterized protein n=1 Tax=Fusarium oxysporum NRRL 32931 TaxID=660029 RepID=W9HVS7_FUSOX|nr:hypothetical protein FOYG_11146 [Fusarium oxysporum NRRL 32931]
MVLLELAEAGRPDILIPKECIGPVLALCTELDYYIGNR